MRPDDRNATPSARVRGGGLAGFVGRKDREREVGHVGDHAVDPQPREARDLVGVVDRPCVQREAERAGVLDEQAVDQLGLRVDRHVAEPRRLEQRCSEVVLGADHERGRDARPQCAHRSQRRRVERRRSTRSRPPRSRSSPQNAAATPPASSPSVLSSTFTRPPALASSAVARPGSRRLDDAGGWACPQSSELW